MRLTFAPLFYTPVWIAAKIHPLDRRYVSGQERRFDGDGICSRGNAGEIPGFASTRLAL